MKCNICNKETILNHHLCYVEGISLFICDKCFIKLKNKISIYEIVKDSIKNKILFNLNNIENENKNK